MVNRGVVICKNFEFQRPFRSKTFENIAATFDGAENSLFVLSKTHIMEKRNLFRLSEGFSSTEHFCSSHTKYIGMSDKPLIKFLESAPGASRLSTRTSAKYLHNIELIECLTLIICCAVLPINSISWTFSLIIRFEGLGRHKF